MSEWSCTLCSFLNHPDLLFCEMCESSKPVSPSETISAKPEPVQIVQDEVTTFQMDDCSCTNGILLQLNSVLLKAKSKYTLSWPHCTHFSQRNSFGSQWSCGYRNIQMMCSSLMQIPAYREKLFSGKGRMPNIRILQQWIEEAWKDGFDSEGCSHFDGKLVGTKEWIGTTECCALLRYFGIRAHIVDFHQRNYASKRQKIGNDETSTQSTNNNNKKYKTDEREDDVSEHIGVWLQQYFRGDTVTSISNSSSSGSSSSSASESEQKFLPPLYFQHQGHSKTIIGIIDNNDNSNSSSGYVFWKTTKNNNNNSESKSSVTVDALILDPASEGNLIKKNLEEGIATGGKKWQRQLRKPLDGFKRSEYQILYVVEGFMSPQERERSKIIDSISISNQFYLS